MTRRRFCPRPYDDRGTSLVLALVFITVGSLVVMAVLAMADTSMKSTIALRGHAAERAAAEGAANIAINRLRNETYDGVGDCFGTGSDLPLPNFYQRPDGSRDSALVTCDLSIGALGTPPWGLATLDTTATGLLGPVGISVTSIPPGASVGSLRVTGDVHSSSNIVIQPRVLVIPSSNLTSSTAIRANRNCSTGSGLFSPNPTCNTGTVVTDPAYATPDPAGLPNRPVPACAATMTFQPGRYTDALSLSSRTSAACQSGTAVLHFTPGVYYFEFGPSNAMIPWLLTAGTVIGGALRTNVALTPGLSVPNRCRSPLTTASDPTFNPDDGVTFVFSGGSQMNVAGSAKVELCGRYAGRFNPPLAVTTRATTGALAAACGDTAWPCAAIWTTTPTGLFVQGTTYLPSRELVLGLNNATNQSLRGGVIARRVWANTTRGTGSSAVIETPVVPYSERPTVVTLNVYVCPGASTCAVGSDPNLRARVSIIDPQASLITGARRMTVLNWSLQG